MVSHRVIAKVAGKMVSLAPAIDISPLLARAVHHSHERGHAWDDLYPTPAALRADLDLFLQLLHSQNGRKSWHRRPSPVVAVGDASDSACAAYFPHQDLAPVHVPLSQAEQAAAATGQLSSTTRELMALYYTVVAAAHLLQHGRLQYFTDCQAEMHSVLGMKGNLATFPWVKGIRLMLAELDCQLGVVWRPRSDPEQRYADWLSKLEDNSQWSLDERVGYALNLSCSKLHLRSTSALCMGIHELTSRPLPEPSTEPVTGQPLSPRRCWTNVQVSLKITSHPCLTGCSITIDLMGDTITTKHPRFYARYWCLGAAGVDALAQPWAYDSEGQRHLGWCYAPFSLVGVVIRKIAAERADVVLVIPAGHNTWSPMLRLLPVRVIVPLATPARLYKPGPQVSAGLRVSWVPLSVCYIVWA